MDYFLIFSVSWWLVFLLIIPIGSQYSPALESSGSVNVKKRILVRMAWATLAASAFAAGTYFLKSNGVSLSTILGMEQFRWEDVKVR